MTRVLSQNKGLIFWFIVMNLITISILYSPPTLEPTLWKPIIFSIVHWLLCCAISTAYFSTQFYQNTYTDFLSGDDFMPSLEELFLVVLELVIIAIVVGITIALTELATRLFSMKSISPNVIPILVFQGLPLILICQYKRHAIWEAIKEEAYYADWD